MNEDKVIQEIITLKERMERIDEKMVTKEDYHKHTGLLENIVTIVKKIQEDYAFNVEWVRRLQAQVEKQEETIRRQQEQIRKQDEEIQQIKLQLKMA